MKHELENFKCMPGGDVIELAVKLGIAVQFQNLEWEKSGYIEHSPFSGGKSGYRIVVNENHQVERQRWTVAHEIAHFLLHRDESDFFPTNEPMNREGLENYWDFGCASELKNEGEANRFAADLLLDEYQVRLAFNNGARDVRKLASGFGVSFGAMSNRLKELNLKNQRSPKGREIWKYMDPSGLSGLGG